MKRFYALFLVALCLVQCADDRSGVGFPEVTTSEAVSVNADGATVSFSVEHVGSKQLVDCGVLYAVGSYGNTTFKLSLGNQNSGEGVYQVEINNNLIEGKEYWAKAYAQTDSHLVYGNVINFVSMGAMTPVIYSVNSTTIDVGDTLEIKGIHFSDDNDLNAVAFGTVSTSSAVASDSLLKVIVPAVLSSSNIALQVTSAGKTGVFDDKLALGMPQVTSDSILQALPHEKVLLKGKSLASVTEVKVGTVTYNPSTKTDTTLVIELNYDETAGQKALSLVQIDREVPIAQKIEVVLPTIKSVNPQVAWVDSVLTLTGTNLSLLESFTLPGTWLQVLSQNDSIVKLQIKGASSSDYISARFYNSSILSEVKVHVLPPVITSVSSSLIYPDQVIRIEGERLAYGATSNLGKVLYESDNVASITANSDLTPGNYSFFLNFGGEQSNSVEYTVPQIEVVDYSPKTLRRGETLTVVTKNYPDGYIYGSYGFKVDDVWCEYTRIDNDKFEVQIPIYASFLEQPTLTAFISQIEATVPNAFDLQESWERIDVNSDYIGEKRHLVNIGGENYACFLESDYAVIEKFNGLTNEWGEITRINAFSHAYLLTSFGIGEKFYLIGITYAGEGMFYCYSITDNSWVKLDNVPPVVDDQGKIFTFVIQGIPYVGTSQSFYSYDVDAGNWIKRASIPTNQSMIMKGVINFAVGNFGYVGFYKYSGVTDAVTEFWKYDSTNDSWIDLGAAPVNLYYGGATLVVDNKVYVAGKGYQEVGKFVEYDPLMNTSISLIPPPGEWSGDFDLYRVNDDIYFYSNMGFVDYWWLGILPLSEVPNIYTE